MVLKKSSYAVPFLFFLLAAGFSATPASAQTTNPVNVKFILPGATETVEVVQKGAFPLGCQHFLLVVLGKGTLGISLVKNDREGDVIFMSGFATSRAGTFPISRTGVSRGMLSQMVEIGEDDSPYGFAWIYSGVSFSSIDPSYGYQLRFSLAP